MSRTKEFYHDEITDAQREARMYFDELYQLQQQASNNECQFVIHVDAPDTKCVNQMLMQIISCIKAGEEESAAEFPLKNGFRMGYYFKKIVTETKY
jgi:hypothetical protein